MLRSTLAAVLVASPFIVLTGRTPATSPNAGAKVERASPESAASVMAGRYRVHLTSTWPQLTGADGCVNGGDESLDGVLERAVDGTYSGTLIRSSRITFCGPHGAETGSCNLTLKGEGPVQATVAATGASDGNGRRSWLTWAPVASGSRASVVGDCGGHFDHALETMYLTVSHGVELVLPYEHAEASQQRIEDYGWLAEVAETR